MTILRLVLLGLLAVVLAISAAGQGPTHVVFNIFTGGDDLRADS
jgi:hypothetical protein